MIDPHEATVRRFAARDAWTEGLRHFSELVRRAPDDALARAHRGFFRLKDSRYDTAGALEDFDAALRLDPSCWAASLYRAITFGSMREAALARSAIEEAARLGATPAALAWAEGCVELEAGSVGKAIERLRRWAEADRGATPAVLLSQAYSQAGDHEQALEWARKAEGIDARDFRAPLYAGIYLAYLRRYDEAARELRRAEAMQGAYPLVHHAWAYVALEQGDKVEAERRLRRSIELDPGYVMSRKWLGDLCAESGRIDEARGHYEAALGRFPDYSDARDALNALPLPPPAGKGRGEGRNA